MDSLPAILDAVHPERLEFSTVCLVNDELRSLEPIFTIQSENETVNKMTHLKLLLIHT